MIPSLLLAATLAASCDTTLVIRTPSYTYSWQAQISGPNSGQAYPYYRVVQPCLLGDDVFASNGEAVAPDATYVIYYNDSHDGIYFPTVTLGPMACARQVSGDRTVLTCL